MQQRKIQVLIFAFPKSPFSSSETPITLLWSEGNGGTSARHDAFPEIAIPGQIPADTNDDWYRLTTCGWNINTYSACKQPVPTDCK